jgi:tetratricopeptide (TPR) repeat protein
MSPSVWRDPVFDQSESTRHLPFFTELAALEEADPAWRSVSAGLVVLRLVDAWVEEGAAAVVADGWGVRSVEAAIEEMPVGLAARAILGGVVDALRTSQASDMHAIAPRLMAYARSLDLDAKWALAADVYETIIAHVHPMEDGDVVITAHLRLAFVLRNLGELDASLHTYETARAIADSHSDLVGVLRAEVGCARIAILRGNLPEAEAALDDAISRAAMHGLDDTRAFALQERADVAYLRGQYDRAVRFAYDALRGTNDPRNRDRLLADIAASFYMLGARSAARDAYLVLEATGQEQYQRWVASINLMEIASVEGSSTLFERYKRALTHAELPPNLEAQLQLHIGEGYARLGDTASAERALHSARRVAAQYQFNQVLFAVEERLANIAQPALRAPASPVPDHLADVAEDVRVLTRGLALL